MHVLRDCVFATRVWLRLLSSTRVATFFNTNDSNWVFSNLTAGGTAIQGHNWQTTFMVTVWYLWQWRNKNIFEEEFKRPFNEVEVILNFVEEILTRVCRETRLPPTLTLHLSDGNDQRLVGLSSTLMVLAGADHQAACGGLLRDDTGKWLDGYTRRLGSCNALHAKMWGMCIGIHMAKQRGIAKLIVESDSKLLVDMLTSPEEDSGHQFTLARRIKQLLTGDWETKIVHTWREGNMCADWLAAFSFQNTSLETIILEDPPGGITQNLVNDMAGALVPRNIRIHC